MILFIFTTIWGGRVENIRETDLLVIGGGPGGYVASLYAAKKGLKVTLIEKRFIGGTCLNIGCIATKALIKSASTFFDAKEAETYGVAFDNVKFDWSKIQERKKTVIDQLVGGIGYLLKAQNVETIFGTASFIDNETVMVHTDSQYMTFKPKNIIIASGSKVRKLKIDGSNLPFVVDSEKMLSVMRLPKSLTIVGGGIIGMEFAFIFGMLGTQVTVLEMMPQILPMVDKDMSQRLLRYAKAANITVITQAAVKQYKQNESGQPTVVYTKNDETFEVNSTLILEAIGRMPSTDLLCIDHTSVKTNSTGAIVVNDFMKTNINHIYAIGDVTNKIQLAHVASHQAIVCVDSIMGHPHPLNYDHVPSVIFTHPQIACIGMTETMLKEKGIAYKITKAPGSANGRALINNDNGLIKLIEEEATGILIGAQIFGLDAESLIAPLTLAITKKMKAQDLKTTVFPHPTTSELIHEAALGLLNEAIHYAQ